MWRSWLRQKLGGPGGSRSLALVSQTVSFPLFSFSSSSSFFFNSFGHACGILVPFRSDQSLSRVRLFGTP